MHAITVVSARARGQDRAAVIEAPHGLVIALADGAGGTGNGELAAQAVIDAVAAAPDRDPHALLAELDRAAVGQTTAVILTIAGGEIRGASVGDSGAWLIGAADFDDLTDGQTRKPLVGSGCIPFAIAPRALGGSTLLVASDGLLRCAKPADIARLARGADLAAAATALVDLVRLPTGKLQDDVSIVLVRS
jgi:serine/threonine protein phosphatase PrpC